MLWPIAFCLRAIRWALWLGVRRVLRLDEYIFTLVYELGTFVGAKTFKTVKEYARVPWMLGHSMLEMISFSLLVGYPAYRSSQLLYETDAEHIFKNVSYGPLPHQQLDLYPVPLSSRTSPSPSPVLLFIQGGGWTICRKDFYPSLGRALRRSGIITVVPDYTTFPRGTMSNMEDDVIMCIQWTLDHVAEYGGDPRRVYLCGQSAGAHLCALAMTRHLEAHMASHVGVHVDDHVDNGPRGDHYDNHDKYQRDHATHATHVNHVNHANRVNHDNHDNHIPSPRGHPSPRGRLTRKCRSMPSLAGLDASARSSAAALWDGIRHVILISGPYDVPALHRHFELQGKDRLANLEEIFEGRGSYEHYSPRHILRRTIAAHGGSALIGVLPPVTLIYAGGDKTISLESTLAFDAELRSVDVKGKVIMYERQSHLEPLMEVLEGFEKARMLSDIVRIVHGSPTKELDSVKGEEAICDGEVEAGTWSWRVRSHVMRALCPV